MQMEKNDNVDPPESPIDGLRCVDQSQPSSEPLDQNGKEKEKEKEKDCCLGNAEFFYDKLSGLYESSGLNLVLNVRETLLNLHVFYKEVTERGGYYQVTKEKRWEDVAMGLKREGFEVKIPQQLQKAYALFLFQFEQIYFYREPDKTASDSGDLFNLGNGISKKRKNVDNISRFLVDEPDVYVKVDTKMVKYDPHLSITGGTMEQKLSPPTPTKPKETKKKSNGDRPKRMRTAYQIFINRECERLRSSHPEKKLKGINFRLMADETWRNLSDYDRKPYIEESNKDKDLHCRETLTRTENQKSGDLKIENGGDYHVKIPNTLTEAEITNNSPAESNPQVNRDSLDKSTSV